MFNSAFRESPLVSVYSHNLKEYGLVFLESYSKGKYLSLFNKSLLSVFIVVQRTMMAYIILGIYSLDVIAQRFYLSIERESVHEQGEEWR